MKKLRRITAVTIILISTIVFSSTIDAQRGQRYRPQPPADRDCPQPRPPRDRGQVAAPLDGGLLALLAAAGGAYVVGRRKQKKGE